MRSVNLLIRTHFAFLDKVPFVNTLTFFYITFYTVNFKHLNLLFSHILESRQANQIHRSVEKISDAFLAYNYFMSNIIILEFIFRGLFEHTGMAMLIISVF
jgi:hypothetical protein